MWSWIWREQVLEEIVCYLQWFLHTFKQCFASWWQEWKSHTQYFDWMNDGERLGLWAVLVLGISQEKRILSRDDFVGLTIAVLILNPFINCISWASSRATESIGMLHTKAPSLKKCWIDSGIVSMSLDADGWASNNEVGQRLWTWVPWSLC